MVSEESSIVAAVELPHERILDKEAARNDEEGGLRESEAESDSAMDKVLNQEDESALDDKIREEEEKIEKVLNDEQIHEIIVEENKTAFDVIKEEYKTDKVKESLPVPNQETQEENIGSGVVKDIIEMLSVSQDSVEETISETAYFTEHDENTPEAIEVSKSMASTILEEANITDGEASKSGTQAITNDRVDKLCGPESEKPLSLQAQKIQDTPVKEESVNSQGISSDLVSKEPGVTIGDAYIQKHILDKQVAVRSIDKEVKQSNFGSQENFEAPSEIETTKVVENIEDRDINKLDNVTAILSGETCEGFKLPKDHEEAPLEDKIIDGGQELPYDMVSEESSVVAAVESPHKQILDKEAARNDDEVEDSIFNTQEYFETTFETGTSKIDGERAYNEIYDALSKKEDSIEGIIEKDQFGIISEEENEITKLDHVSILVSEKKAEGLIYTENQEDRPIKVETLNSCCDVPPNMVSEKFVVAVVVECPREQILEMNPSGIVSEGNLTKIEVKDIDTLDCISGLRSKEDFEGFQHSQNQGDTPTEVEILNTSCEVPSNMVSKEFGVAVGVESLREQIFNNEEDTRSIYEEESPSKENIENDISVVVSEGYHEEIEESDIDKIDNVSGLINGNTFEDLKSPKNQERTPMEGKTLNICHEVPPDKVHEESPGTTVVKSSHEQILNKEEAVTNIDKEFKDSKLVLLENFVTTSETEATMIDDERSYNPQYDGLPTKETSTGGEIENDMPGIVSEVQQREIDESHIDKIDDASEVVNGQNSEDFKPSKIQEEATTEEERLNMCHEVPSSMVSEITAEAAGVKSPQEQILDQESVINIDEEVKGSILVSKENYGSMSVIETFETDGERKYTPTYNALQAKEALIEEIIESDASLIVPEGHLRYVEESEIDKLDNVSGHICKENTEVLKPRKDKEKIAIKDESLNAYLEVRPGKAPEESLLTAGIESSQEQIPNKETVRSIDEQSFATITEIEITKIDDERNYNPNFDGLPTKDASIEGERENGIVSEGHHREIEESGIDELDSISGLVNGENSDVFEPQKFQEDAPTEDESINAWHEVSSKMVYEESAAGFGIESPQEQILDKEVRSIGQEGKDSNFVSPENLETTSETKITKNDSEGNCIQANYDLTAKEASIEEKTEKNIRGTVSEGRIRKVEESDIVKLDTTCEVVNGEKFEGSEPQKIEEEMPVEDETLNACQEVPILSKESLVAAEIESHQEQILDEKEAVNGIDEEVKDSNLVSRDNFGTAFETETTKFDDERDCNPAFNDLSAKEASDDKNIENNTYTIVAEGYPHNAMKDGAIDKTDILKRENEEMQDADLCLETVDEGKKQDEQQEVKSDKIVTEEVRIYESDRRESSEGKDSSEGGSAKHEPESVVSEGLQTDCDNVNSDIMETEGTYYDLGKGIDKDGYKTPEKETAESETVNHSDELDFACDNNEHAITQQEILESANTSEGRKSQDGENENLYKMVANELVDNVTLVEISESNLPMEKREPEICAVPKEKFESICRRDEENPQKGERVNVDSQKDATSINLEEPSNIELEKIETVDSSENFDQFEVEENIFEAPGTCAREEMKHEKLQQDKNNNEKNEQRETKFAHDRTDTENKSPSGKVSEVNCVPSENSVQLEEPSDIKLGNIETANSSENFDQLKVEANVFKAPGTCAREEMEHEQLQKDTINNEKNKVPKTKWEHDKTDIEHISSSDKVSDVECAPSENTFKMGSANIETGSLVDDKDTTKNLDLKVVKKSEKELMEVGQKIDEVTDLMSKESSQKGIIVSAMDLEFGKVGTSNAHDETKTNKDECVYSDTSVQDKSSSSDMTADVGMKGKEVQEGTSNVSLATEYSEIKIISPKIGEKKGEAPNWISKEEIDKMEYSSIEVTDDEDNLSSLFTAQGREVHSGFEEKEREQQPQEASHEVVEYLLMKHILKGDSDKFTETCDAQSIGEIQEKNSKQFNDATILNKEGMSSSVSVEQITEEVNINEESEEAQKNLGVLERCSHCEEENTNDVVVNIDANPQNNLFYTSTSLPVDEFVKDGFILKQEAISIFSGAEQVKEETCAAGKYVESSSKLENTSNLAREEKDYDEENAENAGVKGDESPRNNICNSSPIVEVGEDVKNEVSGLLYTESTREVVNYSKERTSREQSESESEKETAHFEDLYLKQAEKIHTTQTNGENLNNDVGLFHVTHATQEDLKEGGKDGNLILQDYEISDKGTFKENILLIPETVGNTESLLHSEETTTSSQHNKTEKSVEPVITEGKREEVLGISSEAQQKESGEDNQEGITKGHVENINKNSTEEPKLSESHKVQEYDLILEQPNEIDRADENSLEDRNPEVGKGKKQGKEATQTHLEEKTDEEKEEKEEEDEDLQEKQAKKENNMQLEEDKTDEQKEEGEEGDEHKVEGYGHDAAEIVKARDADPKPVHKKSHSILSGVGSKVKHSFSKVKKAITGKSSNSKTVSTK